MSNESLPPKQPNINPQVITLSTGQTVEVPDGADPAYYRRFMEAKLKLAANPKKKILKQKSNSGSTSRRKRTLRNSVPFGPSWAEPVGKAMAEQLDRVNKLEPRFVQGNLEVF